MVLWVGAGMDGFRNASEATYSIFRVFPVFPVSVWASKSNIPISLT